MLISLYLLTLTVHRITDICNRTLYYAYGGNMINIEYRTVVACLLTLIILQVVMLTALYAGIPPHPPVTTPLFGIAPFIGASLACAIAAITVNTLETAAGRVLCILATLLGLISFGPQKYFDAQFGLIWPAVIAGQIAAVCLLVQIYKTYRNGRDTLNAS
jgi:hypothetical protein